MSDLFSIKQRFGIIGNSPGLNRAIDIARQVAPTDLTVLVTGESGSGKENFPKIIHQFSTRKHGPFIAVNCGAIPEGTIDSELFGHEKGSFTGAHDARKGYFEVVNGGTIFLDEVAELPLSTQVRLLRVLESGEFLRVGSSKVIKTDVRIVAATNVNLPEAVASGRFREDLYYRLNTVPIAVPPLRERKEDIILLFRKFATDFAEKYRMPALSLTEDAQRLMINYRWSGNVRQLKNIAEQMSIIEEARIINAVTLARYLPNEHEQQLPVLFGKAASGDGLSERDLLYKVLFEMRHDITELKKLVADILSGKPVNYEPKPENEAFFRKESNLAPSYQPIGPSATFPIHDENIHNTSVEILDDDYGIQEPEEIEESLSLEKKEIEMIKKALEKSKGKRKIAAQTLGISERTLYRKLKEYKLDQ